jgi:hypothetical protein
MSSENWRRKVEVGAEPEPEPEAEAEAGAAAADDDACFAMAAGRRGARQQRAVKTQDPAAYLRSFTPDRTFGGESASTARLDN